MKTEKTLIIIKHDGVARGLAGKIIKRFEQVGLKLVGLEFLQSTSDMGAAHYKPDQKWLTTVGKRTLDDYQVKGLDSVAELGTDDPVKIGMMVREWLIEYMSFGPVLAMIWEGPNAVSIGRKIAGDTRPAFALPGTIRGDFGFDNPDLANKQKRPMYNLIHASGEIAEAEQEIELWFGKKEVMDYQNYASHYTGVSAKMNKSKKRS